MKDTNLNVNEYLPLRDVVFNTLRQAIITGEFAPGERLMEIPLAEELGVKNATLMWPLRIAVAGKLVTPGGAVEICHILGREETIKRVKAGIAKLA